MTTKTTDHPGATGPEQHQATEPPGAPPSIQQQTAEVVMPLAAGYVGHRTIAIGLRQGLVETLADHPEGLTAAELAEARGFDAFYVSVWCQAGLAAGFLEPADREGDRYTLGPHVATLLLDDTSPAYVGAQFTLMEQPEMFDRFEANLASGNRAWWDDASPAFIADVADAGRSFYTRLIPNGLSQIPELDERLSRDCRILDTACGTGFGIIRLATTYPHATVVGADGDAHSLEVARERISEAGLTDRVELLHTPLEELDLDGEFDLVTNNISMHECRDTDRVTANVHAALEPGGRFVISDIPFPDTTEGLRTTPGRVMSGVQFWEAQIDDQLLPRHVYDDLLARHGFDDIGSSRTDPRRDPRQRLTPPRELLPTTGRNT